MAVRGRHSRATRPHEEPRPQLAPSILITAEKSEDVVHTIFHSMADDAKQPRDEAARAAK